MRQHQTTILAVAGSLVALLIPLLVYHQVSFRPMLKDTERAVAEFRPTTLAIPQATWQAASVSLPVVPAAAPALPTAGGMPTATAPAPKVAPVAAPLPSVSFILHDGGKDMAIINGAVLKVGDRYQDWQVARIERTRVLLTGRKGPLWLTLH